MAIDSVGSLVFWVLLILLGLIVAASLTVLLAVVMRRLLGVPVGWARTVIVAAVVTISTVALLSATIFDLSTPVETAFSGVNIGATMFIFLITVLWMLAFGSAALMILELVVPTGSFPSPFRLASNLRGRRRRNKRYREVFSIFARHGLAVPFERSGESATADIARRFRRALEDSGATFVKLGQNLSTRQDVLPIAFTRELANLTSDASPASWETIREALLEELDGSPEDYFGWIDEEPLAAASVAQVHRARLKNGEEVVLKIQRPGSREEVMRDTDILVEICEWLERSTTWGADIGIASLARSFSSSLRDELDYRIEARNQADMVSVLKSGSVVAPEVHEELSTQRLLVMEYFDGITIGRAHETLSSLPMATRKKLGEVLTNSVLQQIMEHGIFHSDVHPGNVILLQEDEGLRLGLLDFGSVGRIDRHTQQNLSLIFAAIDAGDPRLLVDSLLALVGRSSDLHESALEQDVGELLARYRSGYGDSVIGVVNDLFALVAKYRVTIPSGVATALRGMGGLEGTLKIIDPEANIVKLAREQGSDLVKQWVRPDRLKENAEATILEVIPLLRQFPRNLNNTLADMHAGRFTINMRFFNNAEDRNFITRLIQQVTLALLAGFCILGGVVLLTFGTTPPMVTDAMSLLQGLGFIVLFVGFMLALRVVTAVIFRQGNIATRHT